MNRASVRRLFASRHRKTFRDKWQRIYVSVWHGGERPAVVDVETPRGELVALNLQQAELLMQLLAEALMVCGHDPTKEK